MGNNQKYLKAKDYLTQPLGGIIIIKIKSSLVIYFSVYKIFQCNKKKYKYWNNLNANPYPREYSTYNESG